MYLANAALFLVSKRDWHRVEALIEGLIQEKGSQACHRELAHKVQLSP